MPDRRLLAGGAVIGLIAVAMVALVLLSPRWAVAAIDRMTRQEIARSFSATGGAHLDMSPLAIRIEGASLSGTDGAGDAMLGGGRLIIPVSLGQLLFRQPDVSRLTLDGAEVALLIDERGRANWDFPGLAGYRPMQITLQQASLRYFDARNGQSLALANVDGLVSLGADGGVRFAGTAIINALLVRIDADLKSLGRVNADGSPLELALSAGAGSANFSGRLSTAKVLGLAGPLSATSDTPAEALRLIGIPLPDGMAVSGPLNIDGVLDTAGRAYAIRKSGISLGAFRGAGDLVADLRGEQPKLQADLAAETVWLDPFVPASGAAAGEWGRSPIGFSALRAIDAEINIQSQVLSYGGYTAAAARLAVAVKDGRLQASCAARIGKGGTLTFLARADSVVLPPTAALSLAVENASAQPLLGVLTGVTWLTGTGSFSADVSAEGATQEEMAGTLSGTASLALANGRIAGSDLASLFTAARERILAGWQAAPGGTPFTTLSAGATLADGVATFQTLAIDTPAFNLTATGTADLLRRGTDLSATASAAGKPLLPVPVIARGSWSAPRIYPDVPGILTNPEGGFARLKDVAPAEGN